jgi:septation ring formation regulator EzrA
MAVRRPLPVRRSTHDELLREAAELREVAQSRYSEVDLLVAALREHIADLRAERDRLVAELERSRETENNLRDEHRRLSSDWMWRGVKPPRSADD